MHFSGAMASSLYILFPLFIRQLGGSEFVIGLYAGLTGAAAVAARFPVGRLLDTQGRRRVLIASGCLHVVAWLGFLSIRTLGVWSAALVVVYGLAAGSLFAAYFTYASDIMPATRRSEGFAMFGVWGILPNGLGPLLGEFLIARTNAATYFVVAASFALLSVCLSSLLPETRHPARAQPDAAGPANAGFLGRELVLLLMATFIFGATMNSLFTFLAPFAYSRGRGSVGSFFMSYALAAVAVRVLSGRLPDRLGLRRVLAPALLLYTAGLLLVPHVEGAGTLIFAGVLCGAGHGYAFPILSALAVEEAPAAHRGRAVSWLTAMFDLGTTIANPILGAIAEWAGYTAMFTVSGVAMLITPALVVRRPPGNAPGAETGGAGSRRSAIS
jgi:MFS family permease